MERLCIDNILERRDQKMRKKLRMREKKEYWLRNIEIR